MLSKIPYKTLIFFILDNTNCTNFTNRWSVNTIVIFANRIRISQMPSADGKIDLRDLPFVRLPLAPSGGDFLFVF